MAIRTLIFGLMSAGLAADTKPALDDGAVFIETDTGKLYLREAGAWVQHADSLYDLAGAATAAIVAHLAAGDPHSQYLTAAEGVAAFDALGAAAAAQAASQPLSANLTAAAAVPPYASRFLRAG